MNRLALLDSKGVRDSLRRSRRPNTVPEKLHFGSQKKHIIPRAMLERPQGYSVLNHSYHTRSLKPLFPENVPFSANVQTTHEMGNACSNKTVKVMVFNPVAHEYQEKEVNEILVRRRGKSSRSMCSEFLDQAHGSAKPRILKEHMEASLRSSTPFNRMKGVCSHDADNRIGRMANDGARPKSTPVPDLDPSIVDDYGSFSMSRASSPAASMRLQRPHTSLAVGSFRTVSTPVGTRRVRTGSPPGNMTEKHIQQTLMPTFEQYNEIPGQYLESEDSGDELGESRAMTAVGGSRALKSSLRSTRSPKPNVTQWRVMDFPGSATSKAKAPKLEDKKSSKYIHEQEEVNRVYDDIDLFEERLERLQTFNDKALISY
eukprot:GFYU01005279.1.p1 GENE.GFYU01005279.1~~GFYU01005279.1.p1  ORF type:complete len:372 (-),score=40.25 GFYU01005279.1:50-1165(-)